MSGFEEEIVSWEEFEKLLSGMTPLTPLEVIDFFKV